MVCSIVTVRAVLRRHDLPENEPYKPARSLGDYACICYVKNIILLP